MRRTIIIVVTLAVTTLASFAFCGKRTQPTSNGDKVITSLYQQDSTNYKDMWKKVKEYLEDCLPESADKELDAIEALALKNNNQPELLKSILYRQKVLINTQEEDYQAAFIQYAEGKYDLLDEAATAILHCEIANVYANYLDENHYTIQNNLAVDGDISKVEMRYWDKATFNRLIDEHYAKALEAAKTLKTVPTTDFLCLYDDDSYNYYVKYEPSLYDFLFHRICKYYREKASADDIEACWNTESWWSPAHKFVKLELPKSESPLIRCLNIFQQLITENLNDEDLELYNDYKRYQFINSILDNAPRFQDAIRQLMKEHPDSEYYTSLVANLAGSLIKQYEDNPQDSSYFDNYRQALQLCNDDIKDHPNHDKLKYQSTLSHILYKTIGLEMNEVQLPNENIPAIIEYRNTQHPYYQIYKVKESELNTLSNLSKEDLLKKLGKEKAIDEKELTLTEETDYREHSTLIAISPKTEGIYYLVLRTTKDEQDLDKITITNFQVSRLGFIKDEQEEKLVIVTVDRKTSQPMAGVKVEAFRRTYNYKKREYESNVISTLTSDANGQVIFDKKMGNEWFYINLRKGDDVLISDTHLSVPRAYSSRGTYTNVTLFTDRSIYRPGQTVYYQGIAVFVDGDKQTLSTEYKSTLRFRDANWQDIATQDFVTDDYGSFSGSFVIPTDLLNGVFTLSCYGGSTSFRVEEYKRPTFEVNFESVKEQYKLNQEVTLRGSVDAFGGFGLDDIEYSYRIVRKTYFPWRCWWWWYPNIEDEQIAHGTARTDENGKFAISFPLKPSLKTKPEQQPVFTYEIEVTATSAQGETHSATYSIRAGYNEIAISTDIPSQIEKSELKDCTIHVVNMSGQAAKSRVSRKIYQYNNDSKINFFESFGHNADIDREVLSTTELNTLFPAYSFSTQADRMKNKTLVFEDKVSVDDKTSLLPSNKELKPGRYYIELKSLDDPLAITSEEFTVFDKKSNKAPYPMMSWQNCDKTTAKPGETLRFSFGSSATDVTIWLQLMHGDEMRMEKKVKVSNGLADITYTVTEEDRGGLSIKTAFIKENSIQTHQNSISVPYDNLDLNVKLATMRDKLSPGAEETWTVNVNDYQGKGLEAALLASMYDASLDAFTSHGWSFSMKPGSQWSHAFGTDNHRWISTSTSEDYFYLYLLFSFNVPSDMPFFNVWRVYNYRMKNSGLRRIGGYVEEAVMYDMAAPSPEPSNSDDDVVYNKVRVEEESMASGETQESEAGAEPEQKAEEQEPSLRENFNETAFFFPNMRTEADGSATFSFTLPDAITRWKLMMLAYNHERQTGYKEYEFTASKPVMIMADMPRYMYDEDTLWFVANVINTGDETVTPKAKLEIFDAATMEPVSLILGKDVVDVPSIVPGRSHEVRWKVAAKHDLGLLAFRFTAYAGAFSDAEQHLIPVLNTEVFMTQTLPITVKANTEQTLEFEAIANPDSRERDYSLTLNFSTNPVWYAVQSLPYLADVKTDRPENAFYVFYANTLSSYIANNIPNLLAYIKKWQIETPDALMSQLEKDQDLKAIMLQETPWVLEAKSETEQRARIANLFELNTLRQQQSQTLKLLEKKQKYNGGWPWVDGMPESAYITTYILTGFGKLNKMNALSTLNGNEKQKADDICKKAVKFLEYDVADYYRKMIKQKEEWSIGGYVLSELYALSFFPEQNSDKDFAKAKKYFLERLSKKKEWTSFNFNYRAKAAMLLYRSGDEKTAKLMIKSFKECAQKNEAIGMYWPKKYFSFESHIATHAEIMAAFAEIDKDQEMLDQLRIWLLTQKQTNMWENSSSTADAIYALLMRGSDWFAEGKDVTLRWGKADENGTAISTEGGVAGTGFIQRRWNANEVTEEMRHMTVNNPTEHLVWGGLFRQYFVPVDEVKASEGGMNIKREIFVETVNDKGKLLVPVEKQHLKVGDKITVKLTLESQQDMSFVFVKDLRAAGFEPLEQISRYEYDDEMCYYQSNTDTDMEFFIEFLPKGVHQLQYSLFVTKEGHLSNGYALVQCQYAPEFNAYSNGMRIIVGEN